MGASSCCWGRKSKRSRLEAAPTKPLPQARAHGALLPLEMPFSEEMHRLPRGLG